MIIIIIMTNKQTNKRIIYLFTYLFVYTGNETRKLQCILLYKMKEIE